MYEAIQLHIEGMLEDGLAIPESSAVAEYIVLSPSATGSQPDACPMPGIAAPARR